MTNDDRRPDDDPAATSAEGTPSWGADLVGPGTGGSPTAAGTADAGDRDVREAALEDPDVAALVEDLRRDETVLDDDIRTAAEQAGTGTDR